MATLGQRYDEYGWSDDGEPSDITRFSSAGRGESGLVRRDKTDRVFHFPPRKRSSRAAQEELNAQVGESDPALTQWLKEHDVITEFLDAGIGCCWFAQRGDDEPVSGQTEDEAIARLARANGWSWREKEAGLQDA